MIIDPPFEKATLLRRYKRFLADLALPSGETLTVHCPNTGAMTGCAEPGSEAWYSTSGNAKRKYPHTLEVVCAGADRVGVNTGRANAIVAEALESGLVPQLAGYQNIRREVRAPDGSGRFDLFLQGGSAADAFVEVKSMTLAGEGGVGYFPDAVSERALKHVRSLVEAGRRGYRAALVFCVQHTGISEARPAAHIHPAYAEALAEAAGSNVELYALGVEIEPGRLEATRLLPVAV